MKAKKKHDSDRSFYIWINIILIVVSIAALIPFYLVIVTSFTNEGYIMLHGYTFFPKQLSVTAYKWILGKNSTIYMAYRNTIALTTVGTVVSLCLVSMYAYTASRKKLRFRNFIAFWAWIPTVFYAGLIPFYMVLVKLHFQNTYWGLVVPIFMNPFNVFLMLNYFRGLPGEVMESAAIDGASEWLTYLKIVVPMSKPVFATVSLYVILQIWNEWTLTLLLIDNDHKAMYPLQYLLRQIMAQVNYAQAQVNQVVNIGDLPQESLKMATVVMTIGPVILVYPFIQKYFVKGINVGAVKG